MSAGGWMEGSVIGAITFCLKTIPGPTWADTAVAFSFFLRYQDADNMVFQGGHCFSLKI
jgi:hypothetical protein